MAGLREDLLSLVFKEIRNERGFELVDIVQLQPGTELDTGRLACQVCIAVQTSERNIPTACVKRVPGECSANHIVQSE
jgi:hypothetical protein